LETIPVYLLVHWRMNLTLPCYCTHCEAFASLLLQSEICSRAELPQGGIWFWFVRHVDYRKPVSRVRINKWMSTSVAHLVVLHGRVPVDLRVTVCHIAKFIIIESRSSCYNSIRPCWECMYAIYNVKHAHLAMSVFVVANSGVAGFAVGTTASHYLFLPYSYVPSSVSTQRQD